MQNVLISIIIPVYNVEPYLRRCLDSVVNQTYKNLEIILVDDGSTDKSGEICEEYKKKDNRIIVIHQKNQGVSAARNAGLDIFKGEYVSFIDSDDYVDLKFIEILNKTLAKNNADVSVCSMMKIFFNKQKKWLRFKNGVVDSEVFLGYMLPCYFPGKLFNRKTGKRIVFPKKNEFEDAQIYFDVFYNVNSVATCSDMLYFYECNINSLTRRPNKDHDYYFNFFEAHIHICQFMLQKKFSTASINSFCKEFLHIYAIYINETRDDLAVCKIIYNAYDIIINLCYSKLSLFNKIKVRFSNLYCYFIKHKRAFEIFLFPVFFLKRIIQLCKTF